MSRSEFLTLNEVAVHLGIPLGTLREWRHKRIGPPAHKFGRHLRYRLADVEKWVDAQAS